MSVAVRFDDEHPGGAAAHVEVDGSRRWTYVHGARRRPFVHPLATPAGFVLTCDAPADHPWHHGLWFTIKYVNGENFWEEHGEYGVLRHEARPDVEVADGRTTLAGALRWIRPDRTTVVIREQRRLTHVPIDDHAYGIDLATTITPATDVVLDRTPFTTWGGYGGLTFRGRPDLHDTVLLRSDGGRAERVLGDPGAWLSLQGLVGAEGRDAAAGIAMLDAPGNPRGSAGDDPSSDAPGAAPAVPWYASTRADTYGDEGWSNFLNAAFLWEGPLSVAAGEALTVRYRVLVHDGEWDAARVQREHDRFTAEVRPA